VLAADRERTLAELTKSGLLRRNAAVPLALVPLRVGLVTAAGSAAHADFVHELASSGYAFEVLLCDARVQGVTAEADLLAALRTLGGADVDVIAVVRGGGDRTDLLAFDLASVATAIAMSPLPVFCGIGHETDTSVVDQVAHTAAKTPTACAAALVAHVAAFDDRLVGARRTLGLLAERRLARPRARLGEIRLRLGHHAQRHCRSAAGKLAGSRQALQRSRAHAQRAHGIASLPTTPAAASLDATPRGRTGSAAFRIGTGVGGRAGADPGSGFLDYARSGREHRARDACRRRDDLHADPARRVRQRCRPQQGDQPEARRTG